MSTIAKNGKVTTSAVTKRSRPASKLSDSPSLLDSCPTTSQWQLTGLCYFCQAPLEAIQPGGLNVRHVTTHVPYKQCASALKAGQ
jgi:hypothetical protein